MYDLIHIHTIKKERKGNQEGASVIYAETENQHKIKFNKKMVCNYSMKQNNRKFVIFRVIPLRS